MITYPFEMDTIVRLSGNRLVATHYGLYNTICGIGITLGNLLTGAALDASRSAGLPALPWIALPALGLACSAALHGLHRTGGWPRRPPSWRLRWAERAGGHPVHRRGGHLPAHRRIRAVEPVIAGEPSPATPRCRA